MDWYLPNDTAAARQLRLELRDHLGRHADPGSDLNGAVLAASELVTNGIENSDGPVWVSLDWGGSQPVLRVHDLGSGFELGDVSTVRPDSPRGHGLMIATHLVERLSVSAKRSGGSTVTAVLPVHRTVTESYDPPGSSDSLPAVDESGADGTFGRETFLRSLVVQLAQSVELADGPGRAESLVAQVGTGVGGRIEESYRAARQLSGPLSSEEIASLCVELKAAIDGDFFVIDADENRIVLGNRRCPFGDAVKRAPALCRMTSSVFGGIARRNRGAAAVDLQERIAVGDPECRVTVWLRPPDAELRPFVHLYGEWASVAEDAETDSLAERRDRI